MAKGRSSDIPGGKRPGPMELFDRLINHPITYTELGVLPHNTPPQEWLEGVQEMGEKKKQNLL